MTPSANTMKAWYVNITRALCVALFALCLPALAYADPWRDAQEANHAIEAWDYVAAKKHVEALRKNYPENPSVLFVGGKLDFHLGNYRSEEHTSELQSRGHLVCR